MVHVSTPSIGKRRFTVPLIRERSPFIHPFMEGSAGATECLRTCHRSTEEKRGVWRIFEVIAYFSRRFIKSLFISSMVYFRSIAPWRPELDRKNGHYSLRLRQNPMKGLNQLKCKTSTFNRFPLIFRLCMDHWFFLCFGTNLTIVDTWQIGKNILVFCWA